MGIIWSFGEIWEKLEKFREFYGVLRVLGSFEEFLGIFWFLELYLFFTI
jgi:hypothetical protein